MASPGWYPDPAGQPNRFRFWDGQSWSQETTADPYNTPPPGVGRQPQQSEQPTQVRPAQQQPQQQPQQYGQAGQQQPHQGGWPQAGQPQQPQFQQPRSAHDSGGQSWAPGPVGGSADYGSGKKKAFMVVVGVVVVIALIIGGIFGVMALTGNDDDDKSSDDKSSQSSDPSESGSSEESEGADETDGDPSESGSDGADAESESTDPDDSSRPTFGHACVAGDPQTRTSKNRKGRIVGGRVSFAKPKGYKPDKLEGVFTFANDVGVVAQKVEKNWISTMAVGGLAKGEGYQDAEEAADTVMSCMAASDEFYAGFQSRKDLMNEKGKVNGKPAWRIRSKIRIKYEGVKAAGDVADVIVVKLGPKNYGLFVGVAPIGDKKRIKLLDNTISSLRVK